jgi:hypothetical protein
VIAVVILFGFSLIDRLNRDGSLKAEDHKIAFPRQRKTIEIGMRDHQQYQQHLRVNAEDFRLTNNQ